MTGKACGLYEGLSPLPKDPVPGMAYVPYQQWDAQLHSIDRALDAGTLFPVLDKPLPAEGGSPVERRTDDAQALLRSPALPAGSSTCFWDTHPNNKEAARRLEEYQARAQRLGKEYEEKFGPSGGDHPGHQPLGLD